MTGLEAEVRIAHPEAANDQLVVETFGGNDEVSASVGLAALLRDLTVDTGGRQRHRRRRRPRARSSSTGTGNDAVDGNRGNDLAFLGADDDSFTWDPGDGNDTLEGQAGTDTMVFNGSGASENVDISANGPRVRFFRDVANVTMDLDDVEQIDFEALGGADSIVVGDLSGTDLTATNLDLEGVLGGGAGDGQPDNVTVNGTNGDDVFGVAGRRRSHRVRPAVPREPRPAPSPRTTC